MRIGIRNLVPALAVALLLALPATSQATSTLVTESIIDLGFFGGFERFRTEGTDITTEGDDGIIAAENNLVNFGQNNDDTTSWTHDLKSWLSFTPASYSDVLLVITAAGSDNPDDAVMVDEIAIGSLDTGAFFDISITLFSGALLDAAVNDNGMLDVLVTKNGNRTDVFEATLSARVAPVPEPSGVLLFGVGALFVRTAVRKRLS